MIHLVKLCVGIESVDHLRERIEIRRAAYRDQKLVPRIAHTTRMTPKKRDELLDGGSLYWVIKGQIQARQKLLDLHTFSDEEGISRCDIVLDPEIINTDLQPKRPFQGWRYLKAEEAPEDLGEIPEAMSMPPQMRADLRELCLL